MVVRKQFYLISTVSLVISLALTHISTAAWWLVGLLALLSILGIYDIFQRKKNILRNYPVWGHWRFFLLKIRPMIQQYFINSDESGVPFNKKTRDLVYARSQKSLDYMPFGTQMDVHAVGFEWVNHTMQPITVKDTDPRVIIGSHHCQHPYAASVFNISATSFGAISPEAVQALNLGASKGGFYQNTGEGGVSRYHTIEGGDIVFQVGTGYFGCRGNDDGFDAVEFQKRAQLPSVKMIEIKLSQGAKPAHGAILPGSKVNAEIAEARGVEVGKDVESPASHSAFSTPKELLAFITQLRELSGGKPVGIKLCLGNRIEFMNLTKAMLNHDMRPDFITIDGCEGGTGAAPVEFTDHIGVPLNEGIIFIHNTLVGCGIRDQITLIASGKVVTGFDLMTKLALGADICNSARGMFFALGCVQSRRCHDNTCPTGITTQNSALRYGLDIQDKGQRVYQFHKETIHSFLQVMGAASVDNCTKLHPSIIHRRTSRNEAKSYDEIFEYINRSSLIDGTASETYLKYWQSATGVHFNSDKIRGVE